MHQEILITAPTMAQALAKLKRELGPDAMILSHEEHLGSVHITAMASGAAPVATQSTKAAPRSTEASQSFAAPSMKATAQSTTQPVRAAQQAMTQPAHPTPQSTTQPDRATQPRASAQMQDAIILPDGVTAPVWARALKQASESTFTSAGGSVDAASVPGVLPGRDVASIQGAGTASAKSFPSHASEIIVSLDDGEFNSPLEAISALCDLCDYHQLGDTFADMWLNAMNPEFSNPTISLEPALRQSLLHDENWVQSCSTEHPIVLVGPPGSGKTVTIAKLAELLLSLGKDVSVVSLDIIKSTGSRQLELYLKPLGLELDIGHAFLKNRVRDKIVLVDTPGINILDAHDQRYLEALYAQVGSPLTLVLHADMNPTDAAEIATLYKAAGAKFLIATRLDLSRRVGAIVQAATQGLTLALLSKSPNLADGLLPINIQSFLQTMMKASKVHTP